MQSPFLSQEAAQRTEQANADSAAIEQAAQQQVATQPEAEGLAGAAAQVSLSWVVRVVSVWLCVSRLWDACRVLPPSYASKNL